MRVAHSLALYGLLSSTLAHPPKRPGSCGDDLERHQNKDHFRDDIYSSIVHDPLSVPSLLHEKREIQSEKEKWVMKGTPLAEEAARRKLMKKWQGRTLATYEYIYFISLESLFLYRSLPQLILLLSLKLQSYTRTYALIYL